MASSPLGSFVVNLGRLAAIPRGEARVFQIGRDSLAVFHTRDARVLATDVAANGKERTDVKTYPAAVNEEGDILVGIEELLSKWQRKGGRGALRRSSERTPETRRLVMLEKCIDSG